MRPVFPQPGFSEADLENLLASRQFIFADCFTITLVDGVTKFRYATAPSDVSVVPLDQLIRVTYDSRSVIISGLRFRISTGVEVDEQTISLAYSDDDTIQGLKFPEALKQGRLDGATITRDRFFAEFWGAPWIGGIPMFSGIVSTLDSVGRVEAALKVRSTLVLLNINMPRELYTPNCRNTWGDINCTIDQSLFVVNIPVMGGTPTETFIPFPAVDTSFEGGKIHIESGDSVTRIRTIRNIILGSGVDLIYPLDFLPLAADAVAIFPGCPRTRVACVNLYNNEEHFRGFPFVPVAETAQ
jgi:hypothetical protein